MTTLYGAFALAKVKHIPVIVGEHLNLDVARVLDVLLEIDAAVLECGLGLGRAVL